MTTTRFSERVQVRRMQVLTEDGYRWTWYAQVQAGCDFDTLIGFDTKADATRAADEWIEARK